MDNSTTSKRGQHGLRLRTRKRENGSVLIIEGEVDLYSSPQVRTAILDLLDAPDASRVVINLEGVTYIDSSGVATLVEGLHRANSRQRKFSLCSPSNSARKVLELARLDRVFAIHATEEEALSSA